MKYIISFLLLASTLFAFSLDISNSTISMVEQQ